MATIERSIDVRVPASKAYDFWTRFEYFPQFMEGVEDVQQHGDRLMSWRANFWGVTEEWQAEITEQIPDKRIAWTSTTGAPNAGVVTFHRLSDDEARIMLQIEFDPRNVVQKIGDLLGIAAMRVEGDLERFKDHVESSEIDTTGWKGRIEAKPDAAQRLGARPTEAALP